MSEVLPILIPKGFRFGAAKAGLKQSGRTDFGLIVADAGASAAADFTANRVMAAPLIVGKENLSASGGRVCVVAINAGNANCAAGQPGWMPPALPAQRLRRHLDAARQEVFPSSTGIIGVPLPAEKLIAVMPELAAQLGA